MKKLYAFCFILLFASLLAACGSDSEEASTNSGNGEDSKSIKIITTAGGYPFNATNPESNEIEGFMIDIMYELADRTNMETEITTGEWNSLIPSLQSGKADVIVDGMYITEERKEIINFTDPVFGYGEGLIVPAKDTETKSLDDLESKKVGVQMGTSYKDMLEERSGSLGWEIVTYQTLADLLKDIQSGRIDAALADAPSFTYMKSINPEMDYRIVEDYEPSLTGEIGIGVSKDQPELVESLNTALKEIKEDGTLKEIYEKWGVDWNFNE